MIGEIDATPWEMTVIMRNNVTSFEQYVKTDGSEVGSLAWFDYDNDQDLDLYNRWSLRFQKHHIITGKL